MINTDKDIKRCPRCSMRLSLCLCNLLKPLTLKTEIQIVMHHRETKLYSNSARLAHLMLKNSRVFIRGREEGEPLTPLALEMGTEQFSKAALSSERENLVLFPSETSVELSDEIVRSFKKPITLIVPDGSWRQAARIPKREPALQGLKHVKLPPGPPSNYRLRREHHPHYICTFEAISRALAILEGPQTARELDAIFEVMVERVLWSRSHIKPEQCKHPIPAEALHEWKVAGFAPDKRPKFEPGGS